MIRRRSALLACLSGPLGLTAAEAQQRKSLAHPLRLGVDVALMESGLAKSLQRSFGLDTGIAVQLVPAPALTMLESLENGELDAALSNAPEAELELEKLGLLHDRRPVAQAGLVLVGPPPPKGAPKDAALALAGTDIALALQRLSAAGGATPAAGSMLFLSAGDGSGVHVAEQPLWRAAKVAPAGAWYATAVRGSSLAAQARARGAYALVERGSWGVLGGAPLVVLVDDDPLLQLPVHVMRSFRVNHPAGKIFVAWVSGPKGSRVVARHRGYRAPRR